MTTASFTELASAASNPDTFWKSAMHQSLSGCCHTHCFIALKPHACLLMLSDGFAECLLSSCGLMLEQPDLRPGRCRSGQGCRGNHTSVPCVTLRWWSARRHPGQLTWLSWPCLLIRVSWNTEFEMMANLSERQPTCQSCDAQPSMTRSTICP